jgi:nitrate/nitrite transporter NarK
VAGGFVFTMGANVVGHVFPPETQGRATSVFITSAPVGFALAQAASPLVATAIGLRAVLLAYVAIAAVGYLCFLLVTPKPVRSGGEFALADIRRALTNRAVLLVALSAFCAYALYLFLNSWMPTYGAEVLSIPLAGAGAVTALVPVVGIVARPTGGYVSDRLGRRRQPVIDASLCATLAVFLVIPLAGTALAYAALLLLAGVALQLSTGVYYVFTRELATAGTEGTSLTVMTTVAFTGSLVSPLLGGYLIEALSWGPTFAVYAVVGVAGIGFALLVRSRPAG